MYRLIITASKAGINGEPLTITFYSDNFADPSKQSFYQAFVNAIGKNYDEFKRVFGPTDASKTNIIQ